MPSVLFQSLNPLKLSFSDRFFLELPELPGVYRMYDEDKNLLYVGKAKNLKARLQSYRTTNPLQLPRKVARLILKVRKIEFDVQDSEEQALLKENQLLRTLKPPYNSRNVYPELYSILGLKFSGTSFEWMVCQELKLELQGTWEFYGCFKGKRYLLETLAGLQRLIFLAGNSGLKLPSLLQRDRSALAGSVVIADWKGVNLPLLRRYLRGTSATWLSSVEARLLRRDGLTGYDAFLIGTDLTRAQDFFDWGPQRNARLKRDLKLKSYFIPQEEMDDCLVRVSFKK